MDSVGTLSDFVASLIGLQFFDFETFVTASHDIIALGNGDKGLLPTITEAMKIRQSMGFGSGENHETG